MHAFPAYIFVFLVFVNRYILGSFLKLSKGKRFDVAIEGYEPTVTIVTPSYNEGKGIYDCILSSLDQDYPPEKLDVIAVDDCSRDNSFFWATQASLCDPARVTILRNECNLGKRESIIRAVRRSKSEIIVTIDSDVVTDRDAIRQLVSRFSRTDIAAVGGRVNVLNAKQNWLTRMQAIRYYFAYQYLKNLERAFLSVVCLSGCLTAYRRSVLLELEPTLRKRNFLGVPVKYGEDRFLTHQILKAGYKTYLTLDAVCWTVAPDTMRKFWSQQLRWRRSTIVDFLASSSYAWKLHPIVALHYFSLSAIVLTYPIIIYQNLADGVFGQLIFFHLCVLGFLGSVYYFDTKNVPPERRVHPVWFLAMAVVMPVTYLTCTMLALFTLDSSNWETRTLSGSEPASQNSDQSI